MIFTEEKTKVVAAIDLWKAFDKNSDPERRTVVNVIEGHYGLWGYAIVLNGSPDHGCILIDLSRKIVRYFRFGKVKTFTERRSKRTNYDRVIEFLEKIGYPTETGKSGIESIGICGIWKEQI